MSFRVALSVGEDEAEIMKQNGHETAQRQKQLDQEDARGGFLLRPAYLPLSFLVHYGADLPVERQ